MNRIDIGGDQGRHPDGVEVGKPASRFRDSVIGDCPPECDISLPGDGASPGLGLLAALAIAVVTVIAVVSCITIN